ncbi:MipA/OmpV family protein [Sphingobium sp. RAC03]|uniref:MipA/OmpV family protein n=1 Tax=Sphingobium sp. RAC03 TaxID=1843368 RepID=UPI000857C91B|nr:mltA-interacting MipA domain protein [Sphingobium sp. RAC03]
MRYLLAIAALGAGQPCFSQTAETQPATVAGRPLDRSEAGWSVTIGLAPVLSPAWQGSRDMALSIFPDLRVNYGDVIFASIPEGLGWNAVNTNGWKAGPLAKVRWPRSASGVMKSAEDRLF